MKFHRTLPIIFQNFQIYTKVHLKLLFYLKNHFTQFSKKFKISLEGSYNFSKFILKNI